MGPGERPLSAVPRVGVAATCQLNLFSEAEVSSLMPSMLSISAFPKVLGLRWLRATSPEKVDFKSGNGLKIRSLNVASASVTKNLPDVWRMSGAADCFGAKL